MTDDELRDWIADYVSNLKAEAAIEKRIDDAARYRKCLLEIDDALRGKLPLTAQIKEMIHRTLEARQ